jgi:diguanylate cyclase (GGDEF)-like protein
MGAGMVCILFTLILSGCLLDKRQAYLVITINLVIFIALTELLAHGNFDGTNMEVYKKVWFINAITTQVCGILLFIIMNTMHIGLENQIKERIIKEEKILYLNYHDSLTGLYNRAFFEKEIERLDTESQLPLSVITGDINGLKLINDWFGHVEGDKLLISVSKILENCCRKTDIIARIGGDEFNILLPRTSSEVTYGIIENINSSCEEYNKKVTRELNYTSISLGSATKISIEEPLDTIFKVSEDYMYKRKLLESRSILKLVTGLPCRLQNLCPLQTIFLHTMNVLMEMVILKV